MLFAFGVPSAPANDKVPVGRGIFVHGCIAYRETVDISPGLPRHFSLSASIASTRNEPQEDPNCAL